MHLIIELDGPVLNVEPVYWAAYTRIVAELGLARKDRSVFWTLQRRGAGLGEMLLGAKPRHLQHFREGLAAALELEECWAQAVAQPDAADELRALRVGQHALTLVTLGRNAKVRQAQLDAHHLSADFTRMARLAADPFQRLAQLKELTEGRPRVLVAAGTEPLLKLADEAGLVAVGLANGPCTAQRLTRAGARLTFADLHALGEEIVHGAPQLIAAGLLPPAAQAPSEWKRENERWSSRRR